MNLVREVKRQYYHVISLILVIIVTASLLYWNFSKTEKATPPLLYSAAISPRNSGVLQDVTNASQGTEQKINLTLTSMCSTPIVVPVENLTLIAYNSTINYYDNWNTTGWSTSIVQQKDFGYSLSIGQLTLQPKMSNSTVITIKWAENAPTGRFAIDINLGKLEFLSAPENHDLPYYLTIWLGVIVTPKSGQT